MLLLGILKYNGYFHLTAKLRGQHNVEVWAFKSGDLYSAEPLRLQIKYLKVVLEAALDNQIVLLSIGH